MFILAPHTDSNCSIIIFEQTALELQVSASVSTLMINDLAHLDKNSRTLLWEGHIHPIGRVDHLANDVRLPLDDPRSHTEKMDSTRIHNGFHVDEALH